MKQYLTLAMTSWKENSVYVYYLQSGKEEIIENSNFTEVVIRLNAEGYFISAIEGVGIDKAIYMTKEI